MRKVIAIVSILIVLLVIGYVYYFYYHPYGEGLRDGVVQKFSRKGYVFKTYEGEMILLGFGQRGNTGMVNSNYFYFSVSDKTVADSLNACTGKLVKLHYTQYLRSLPWRGDNYNGKNAEQGQYIVDKVASVTAVNTY